MNKSTANAHVSTSSTPEAQTEQAAVATFEVVYRDVDLLLIRAFGYLWIARPVHYDDGRP